MNLNNRILVFSYDAGGANLAMAYAYFMNEEGYEVKCFPKGPAVKIFENHIPNLISNEDITFLSTDIIVTGTSGIHSDYEMKILNENKNRVFKTISFLDGISNIKMRFSINSIILKEEYLPDEIRYDGNETEELSFLRSRIVNEENLYLKYLKEVFYKRKLKTVNSDIIKNRNKYLLVLTEYVSELYGDVFGFDEYNFLEDILEVIKDFDIPIFLKLHPAEKSNKYDKLLFKYKNIKLYKDDYNIQEVLYNCKLVLGLNSSVFKEALLLEKPFYSVQIGAKKSLNTISNVKVIKTRGDLRTILIREFEG